MDETAEQTPKGRYRTGITKAILLNSRLPHPLVPTDLADALGVPPSTIYRIATRLRKEGRLAPSDRQEFAKSKAPTPILPPEPSSFFDRPPTEWDSSDLAAIDRLPILTADQRKKLLSAIGMRPGGGLTQTSAIGKLDDLDKGAASQIGPPPPLTEQQQIERLSRLMRAVGHSTATKSMEAAFEQATKDNGGSPKALGLPDGAGNMG